jgi:cation transport ATPase
VRVLEKALVTVALPSTTDALTKMVAEKQIQIVLLEKNLERLGQLFDVAAQFAAKQRFNLAWPLLMDVVDLATTIFFHMGLTYSILFSYSGLLLSAINAKLPLMRYQREQVAAGQDRLLPLPKRNLSP